MEVSVGMGRWGTMDGVRSPLTLELPHLCHTGPWLLTPMGLERSWHTQEASAPQTPWNCQGCAHVTLSLCQDRCPGVYLSVSP